MVILGPIFQLGCRRASSLVTLPSCSRSMPKKGPPEQVRINRRTSALSRTPIRHWKIAECSESTGTISAPHRFASAITSSPAQTRVSLLARPMRFPARMAARVGFSPSIPTTAVMTQSASPQVAAASRPSSPHMILVGRSLIKSFSARAPSRVPATASSGRNSRHCSASL